MAKVRNILFIMCDQLRRDYLSCYGHPTLPTPHIDALAAKGTRFNHAYVQGPVCGPSRMSTYTGRYVSSHGATWNFVPLSLQIPTLGDYMRSAGLRNAVIGKTHVLPDLAGLHRLGLAPTEGVGRRLAEGGFDNYARHDGIIPDSKAMQSQPVYNQYLLQQGYIAANPWHEFANAALDETGQLQSGWSIRTHICQHELTNPILRPRGALIKPFNLYKHRANHHGVCTCPTSNPTGPILRQRLTTNALMRKTSKLLCAQTKKAQIHTLFTKPFATMSTVNPLRSKVCGNA